MDICFEVFAWAIVADHYSLTAVGTDHFNNFTAHAAIFDKQFAQAYRQLEASRTGAAGVEIEHSSTDFLLRNMAVAADHDGKSGGLRLDIELREIVQHMDENAGYFEHFGPGQLLCPCSFVNVPAYRGDWGNCRKNFNYFGRADVSSVDDVIRAAQSFDCFGAQQAVGIGDDADQDRTPQVLGLSAVLVFNLYNGLGCFGSYTPTLPPPGSVRLASFPQRCSLTSENFTFFDLRSFRVAAMSSHMK